MYVHPVFYCEYFNTQATQAYVSATNLILACLINIQACYYKEKDAIKINFFAKVLILPSLFVV